MQRLRLLTADRGARQAEGRFAVEGVKLLGEARQSGATIDSVYLDPAATAPERAEADACARAGARVHELQPGVLARVADSVTPQGVAAIVDAADVSLAALGDRSPDFLVICIDLRDPGNLGTVLRSAGAAGASGVLCTEGSVDVYNPKAVRSSAGAVFQVPVVTGADAKEVLDEVGRWGLSRWGTSSRSGTAYTSVDLTGPVALVVGNEAHGLPDWIDPHLDGTLRIPMAGSFESLNVAAAASILCFEVARQRGDNA